MISGTLLDILDIKFQIFYCPIISLDIFKNTLVLFSYNKIGYFPSTTFCSAHLMRTTDCGRNVVF